MGRCYAWTCEFTEIMVLFFSYRSVPNGLILCLNTWFYRDHGTFLNISDGSAPNGLILCLNMWVYRDHGTRMDQLQMGRYYAWTCKFTESQVLFLFFRPVPNGSILCLNKWFYRDLGTFFRLWISSKWVRLMPWLPSVSYTMGFIGYIFIISWAKVSLPWHFYLFVDC